MSPVIRCLLIDAELPGLVFSYTFLTIRHATLLLEKDKELFSKGLMFKDIPKEEISVPTLMDVCLELGS
ncbi:hypothetical protein VP01_1309g7 [Puccinia sorghi]|uniref:Uncharacterized protein n=1 Tax=Puccinia sorghi TaxID=27349 RepID=A0A0L6VPQ6_9BASI|nr:hypothetical protein VP01_1309g7 [Puccinia sorghi]